MGKKEKSNFLHEIRQKYSMYFVLLFMFIAMVYLSPPFLSYDNLINLLRQSSVIGLLALGVTLVIITGGIDLSSGSIIALIAMIVGSLIQTPDAVDKFFPNFSMNYLLAIAVVLVIGLIVGSVSGLLISYTLIPPFIATLGMMVVARGAAKLYTDGKPISYLDENFLQIGQGSLLGVPIPVLIFIFFSFVTWVILNYTKIGKCIYAIGGNINAAKVSGINVNKVIVFVYSYAAFLSAVGAVILTSRVGAAQPSYGTSYELDAIAAASIGGTSFSGGMGTIGGTIIGVLILGIINNGFTLLGINAYWQEIIKGAIIVTAVVFDMRKNKTK